MIGVCTACGRAFETTEEDANTPGVVCPPCHWQPEAVRLVDTFGAWVPPAKPWWTEAGWPNPPWGLVEAVKLECVRRTFAADPQPAVKPFTHFTPHES